MSGRKKVYWDSCIYLAWLNDEPGPHLAHIHAINQDNLENKLTIITSTLTMVEVLERKLPPDKERDFMALFNFQIHEAYELDIGIALRAREIRGYYLDQAKPRPSCPDAIHLATAIVHDVDVFHTFDDGKKVDPMTKEKFSLLGNSGKIAGYSLKIERPLSEAPSLESWAKSQEVFDEPPEPPF